MHQLQACATDLEFMLGSIMRIQALQKGTFQVPTAQDHEAHRESLLQAGLAEVVAAGRRHRVPQDQLAQRAGELPQRALLLGGLRTPAALSAMGSKNADTISLTTFAEALGALPPDP